MQSEKEPQKSANAIKMSDFSQIDYNMLKTLSIKSGNACAP